MVRFLVFIFFITISCNKQLQKLQSAVSCVFFTLAVVVVVVIIDDLLARCFSPYFRLIWRRLRI